MKKIIIIASAAIAALAIVGISFATVFARERNSNSNLPSAVISGTEEQNAEKSAFVEAVERGEYSQPNESDFHDTGLEGKKEAALEEQSKSEQRYKEALQAFNQLSGKSYVYANLTSDEEYTIVFAMLGLLEQGNLASDKKSLFMEYVQNRAARFATNDFETAFEIGQRIDALNQPTQ